MASQSSSGKKTQSIGKYRIVKELAKGGMGAVYLGRHPTLKRPVILKKLTLKGSPQFAERFKREARIMMGFNHDNIVDVYDHFKVGQSDYIVLEYVDGMSLEDLLRQERYLPNDLALYIFREAARALHYAHGKGVVHRDIKPANLLISRNGEIKLVDFGIATSGEDQDDGLTQEGMTLGTPSYMSPEQIADSKNVDKRADIYSLGVMLYEMTTGKKPYPGSFTAEAIAKIQKGKYPSPRKHNPNISTPLVKLIRRMMKPKQTKRYQTLEKPLKIANRRLKRKNVLRILKYLTSSIRGTKREPLGKPLSLGKKLLITGVPALLVCVLLGSILFIRSGLYYEIFQPRHYGALRIDLTVPASLGEPRDLRLTASLYQRTEGGERSLDQLSIPFRKTRTESFLPLPGQEQGAAANPETLNLTSGRLYLPSDSYRLQLVCENQIFSESFYLESRFRRRQQEEGTSLQVLSFRKTVPPPLPLEISWTVRDEVTGELISRKTRAEVFHRGSWRPLIPSVLHQLQTGQEHRFRLSAPGYQPRELGLAVGSTRTQLSLEAALTPQPASVTLTNRSEIGSLRLLVNGSRVYRDSRAGDVTAPFLREEPVTLHIVPGENRITVARSQKTSVEIPLELAGGVSRNFQIYWDGETQSLTYQAQP